MDVTEALPVSETAPATLFNQPRQRVTAIKLRREAVKFRSLSLSKRCPEPVEGGTEFYRFTPLVVYLAICRFERLTNESPRLCRGIVTLDSSLAFHDQRIGLAQ
jgi:hypothetical protein